MIPWFLLLTWIRGNYQKAFKILHNPAVFSSQPHFSTLSGTNHIKLLPVLWAWHTACSSVLSVLNTLSTYKYHLSDEILVFPHYPSTQRKRSFNHPYSVLTCHFTFIMIITLTTLVGNEPTSLTKLKFMSARIKPRILLWCQSDTAL